MAKYHITNKAMIDLESIWNYTVKTWSEQQADSYYEMLISLCQPIADNPACGKSYDDIADNLYEFIANKHIIFYRVVSQGKIEIVRILHGRMDLKNRIRE